MIFIYSQDFVFTPRTFYQHKKLYNYFFFFTWTPFYLHQKTICLRPQAFVDSFNFCLYWKHLSKPVALYLHPRFYIHMDNISLYLRLTYVQKLSFTTRHFFFQWHYSLSFTLTIFYLHQQPSPTVFATPVYLSLGSNIFNLYQPFSF